LFPVDTHGQLKVIFHCSLFLYQRWDSKPRPCYGRVGIQPLCHSRCLSIKSLPKCNPLCLSVKSLPKWNPKQCRA